MRWRCRAATCMRGAISRWRAAGPRGWAEGKGAVGGGRGRGVNGSVDALAVSGSDVYAGGVFMVAPGGVMTTNIAKWNGTSWSGLGSALGSGINDVVYAVAVSGSDLYAGGSFTTADGSAA